MVLIKMQIPGSHPRTSKSESPGVVQESAFKAGRFLCTLKVGPNCMRREEPETRMLIAQMLFSHLDPIDGSDTYVICVHKRITPTYDR